MTKELIDKLILMKNFGISNIDQISVEEKKKRANDFLENYSFEQYENLFIQINAVLIDDNVSVLEKNQLTNLLLECIDLYTKLKGNIDKFPKVIKEVYCSYNAFKLIEFGVDNYLYPGIVAVRYVEDMLVYYMDFMDDPNNQTFLDLCFDKIEQTNEKIIREFEKSDQMGIVKETLIKTGLVQQFKTKIGNLKKGI